uniref:Snf7 family protein n=1 Tax=Candidatus Methanosuratincola petrocarbonis (ex Vanwonterghem et al. 2016) TaxID=1867261 RepID=A0A7J3UYR9_9CREN
MRQMGLLRKSGFGAPKTKIKGPIRPMIEEAIRILTQQQIALNIKLSRIRNYDRILFERVVQHYQNRDLRRAKMYANELGEVRKLIKAMTAASLALEQIAIRLRTVKEYGDFARDISVARASLDLVCGSVPTIMSESGEAFSRLNEIMDELMVNAASTEAVGGGVAAMEGSEEIMQEAQMRAESELERTLPKIPEFDKKGGLRERDGCWDGLV